MVNQEVPEILVSIDGEFTGLIPGPFSMISFGAVAYADSGEEPVRFKINLKELPDAGRDARVMRWWKKHPKAWRDSTADPCEPKIAMELFDTWLRALPGRPKLMGWPLPVDFMFVYWYYVRFIGTMPPFGFDGIDIKTYAYATSGAERFSRGESGSFAATQKSLGLEQGLSHDPAEDAAQQGEAFFALRRLNRVKRSHVPASPTHLAQLDADLSPRAH